MGALNIRHEIIILFLIKLQPTLPPPGCAVFSNGSSRLRNKTAGMLVLSGGGIFLWWYSSARIFTILLACAMEETSFIPVDFIHARHMAQFRLLYSRKCCLENDGTATCKHGVSPWCKRTVVRTNQTWYIIVYDIAFWLVTCIPFWANLRSYQLCEIDPRTYMLSLKGLRRELISKVLVGSTRSKDYVHVLPVWEWETAVIISP